MAPCAATLLSEASQAEVNEIEDEFDEFLCSNTGNTSPKPTTRKTRPQSAPLYRCRETPCSQTSQSSGGETKPTPEVTICGRALDYCPTSPSGKTREGMQRDYELSAFNRRQVYSKSVHRPPLKAHPSKMANATLQARPKSARARTRPDPFQSEFSVYVGRSAASSARVSDSIAEPHAGISDGEQEPQRAGVDLEADLDVWLTPGERLSKAECAAKRASSSLAAAVQDLHVRCDSGQPLEQARRRVRQVGEEEVSALATCLALAKLQLATGNHTTSLPDLAKLSQAHLQLSAAYLDRGMFHPASEHAASARLVAEEAYELVTYELDAGVGSSLRRIRTASLLQQAECAVLQKHPKPAAAMELLEEAQRGDGAMCQEGDPSRVPMLFIRADARRGVCDAAVKETCKLLGTSTAGFLELSALAVKELDVPGHAVTGLQGQAPQWHLQEWEHEGERYLIDAAAARVFQAPETAGSSDLHPVGRISEDGEISWVSERRQLFALVLQKIRDSPEDLRLAWAQATRDSASGLNKAESGSLLEILVPDASDTEAAFFQAMLDVDGNDALTITELESAAESCSRAEAACRDAADPDGWSVVCEALADHPSKALATFKALDQHNAGVLSLGQVKDLARLLVPSLDSRDVRALLCRLHAWDVEDAGQLGFEHLQRALGACAVVSTPYQLADNNPHCASAGPHSALEKAAGELARSDPRAHAEWRDKILNAATQLAEAEDDLMEAWDILDALADGEPHPQQARVYARMKDLHRLQGKWEHEAMQYSKLAVHIRSGAEVPVERVDRPKFVRQKPEPRDVKLASIEGELALLRSKVGDFDAAIAHCEVAWDLYTEVYGDRVGMLSTPALKVLKLKALLLAKGEHLVEAAAVHRTLIKHQRRRKGPGSISSLADVYMQLAATVAALSDDPALPAEAVVAQLEEVCSCYQKAIVLYSKRDSPANKLKWEDATQRLVEVQKLCDMQRRKVTSEARRRQTNTQH